LNHERLNTGNGKKYGIDLCEVASLSSPPSRSQMNNKRESGFGGWADEKIKNSPRGGSSIEPKNSLSTTFDNSS
jgi:hypothetical protein